MSLAGCGAAWIAHLTGGQGVGGSNPPSPTNLAGETLSHLPETPGFCAHLCTGAFGASQLHARRTVVKTAFPLQGGPPK
jgi:hypothetical protein